MIAAPSTSRPLVEVDLSPTQQTRTFFNALVLLPPLTGIGSPEGVVEAAATRLYMDTTGTAGNIIYIKKSDSVTDDKKLGWILV
jgi:hypothetical protein